MLVQRTSPGWRPDHPECLRVLGSAADPKDLTAQILRAADGGPTIPKTPPEQMPRTHVRVCYQRYVLRCSVSSTAQFGHSIMK